jgi:conjugative relaxase-like TrwC/TraI family protein
MHRVRSLCDDCVTKSLAASLSFWSAGVVMSASSIPAARGGDYARYLEGKTVAPERGDYYLTPDGELTQAPGRWLADPETLQALGIEPEGPASGEDFVALMEGRHPQTGAWLRRAGPDGARGGGIDGVLSAPKSVSTVWALADPWQRAQIEQAHANAVEQTVAYMREHVPLVRRRYGAEVVEEPAKDLIAVEYRHTTARGVAGAQAPDPQLHSHVVITSAVRSDDRIVAVASRPVFRGAGELGAYYRSALARELMAEGYPIERGTGKDGKYFEIAGVPEGLRDAFSGRSREVARAADRFRARYGRAPERGELRDLALENRRAKTLTNRADLENAWRETGDRYAFGPQEALNVLAAPPPDVSVRPVEDRIEERLTERHAVFEQRDLYTVALEQTAGELSPCEALDTARGMVRDRRILTLEGGRMTTLGIRAQEQAIERRAANLAKPADRDVGYAARTTAMREVVERIGNQLSDEQELALLVLTGPERASVLVGPAGTGKGVVIDAAARAEQLAGHETLGIAVSGSTAERLATDSPALEGATLTLDALVARAQAGKVHVGQATTVFLDEAGMVDHKRLAALTELIERSGAKLIAVGDGKQLPSIGPGGMFERLTEHAPTVELDTIHRTTDPHEQRAWGALRAGEPERAMAHYHAHGRLHLTDTRDQAAENAVQAWAQLTNEIGIDKVALIADSSNVEIDRLNARAQHLRAQRGELGQHELPLDTAHYGLREGDHVAFIAQHRPPRQARVENGTRGEITRIDHDGTLSLTIDGSGRKLRIGPEDAESLRLAYAQHVYRQQGATVDRSIVLTGGWQTSRETAYVQASRARKGTDWHIARDQLSTDGQDPDRIEQLAQRISNSRLHTPSVEYELHDPTLEPNRDPLRLRGLPSPLDLARALGRHAPEHDDIERGR